MDESTKLVELLSPLIDNGILGAILAWFMFKTEARLRGIEDAIDRANRAILIASLSMRGFDVKSEVQSLQREVEVAQEKRNDK